MTTPNAFLPPPPFSTLGGGGAGTPMSPATPPVSSTPNPPEKHLVHWFRKGLRMHDNPSLREGLKSCSTFRCVFILDPWFATSNVGINKWRFLLQCLEDLDSNLRKMNSRLFVIRGQPADILPKLFKEWKTTCLTFEEDPEPFGKVRDQNIMTLCKGLNIEVVSRISHTLYDLDQIIEKNNGKCPLTYHQFQSIVAKLDPPNPSEPSVSPLLVRGATTPIREDHDDKYGVPTLEELGFDTEGLLPPIWKGGETEAMRRLERHLERKAWVASFGRPKMTPQSLLASQTGLSPYLRFGCLSTRLFYHDLNKLYKRIKKAAPPLSLHGQLLWREFFYCAATRNPNFDRMAGNPICVQVPWDTNMEALAKWANAQTGFPWIDAIMTQLREEGWIHHLARHAVACFLTRGDLWVSWEEGMKIFDELLLDADWSVNAGMWMWLSCSSFFQQFFHCYCPVKFGRKADPNGDFIRRYLPILKNMPTRYIHEPWTAPISVQKASRCVVGVDYPLPMVNHPVVSKINIERIKQVYRQLANYKGAKPATPSLLQAPLTTGCPTTKLPKSPEAMSIETYACLVTPPSCVDSPLPSPFTPPIIINTDVIQYPPCCPGDQYVEPYTISRAGKTTFNVASNLASMGSANSTGMSNPGGQQGKGMLSSMRGGKPMQPMSRGKPMSTSMNNTSRGKPMETSMGQPINTSRNGVKPMSRMGVKPLANTPMAEKQMHYGGKPMITSISGGKPMQSIRAGGKSVENSPIGSSKLMHTSPIGGKSMMMDTQVGGGPMNSGVPMKPSRQVTMDDQISGISGNNYQNMNQSKVDMQADCPMQATDCPMPGSNCSMEDGNSSTQDGNDMLTRDTCDMQTRDTCDDSNEASAALLSEIVGTLDEPPHCETMREGGDRLEYSSEMRNEESNAIDIADSIISESEQRQQDLQ